MTERARTWTGALLGALVLLSACADGLLENPSFDLWCGDQLCGWDLDDGDIERVPTWHEKDYGISFEETPTQISQLSTDGAAECLHFEVIADTDAAAKLTLEVDFDDDGHVEWKKVLPKSRWKSREYWVNTPSEFESMRFIVRKGGTGRAVLAQLHVLDDGTCGSFADDVE